MSGDPVRLPRRALAGLGILLLGAIAAAYWLLRAAPDRHLNLLLITLDTTRADHLPAYGYGHVETPALDRMARNGTRYARCYSPAPLTLPAHASIMTGLYPFSHGIRANGAGALGEGAVTLAEVLRSHGYATAAVVGAQVLASEYGLDQGFEHYDDDFSGDAALPRFRYAERNAGVTTDAAIAWLDRLDDSPFFLWTHYFDPHMPYETPGYDPATATAAPYDVEISYADSQLDRLVQRVGEIQQSTQRPTLVVFAADHGEALWDHGEPTHGFFVYDETLHVPLIVFLPSAVERGAVIDTPVSLVDLYPSILRWLDLPLLHEVDGIPLPRGGEQGTGLSGGVRPIYFESYVPLRSYGWSPLQGIIVGSEKFIAAPKPELYDLASDPHETHNRVAEAGSRVRAFEHSLKALQEAPHGRPPLVPRQLPVDEESLRMLRDLGYAVQPAAPSERSRRGTDPKDGIELHRMVLSAQTEIAEGDFATALEELGSVLERDPDNSRALFLLLDLLNEADARAGAARAIDGRMQQPLSPPFDRLLPLYLGMIRSDQGRWDEAETALRVALESAPEDPQTNYYMARALLAREAPVEPALAHLERAHRLDPTNIVYASALVQLAEGMGDLERALEVADRLYEEHPDHPLALNNSAWLHYRTGRDPEIALAQIERAVALEPANPRFLHTYGCVLLWLDRAEEALAHLRSAGELPAGSPESTCPRAAPPALRASGAGP